MPLTRKATAVAASLADLALADQKEVYASKLRRLQSVFAPSLSNAELSAGLGLAAPVEGGSDVGRFLSVAPRNRRARPDTATRALIDAIVDGRLLFALRPASVPGARREVLVLTAADLGRLPRWWDVRNVAGGPVPLRAGATPDWDDAAHWDLFGSTPTPALAPTEEPSSPPSRTAPPTAPGGSGPPSSSPAAPATALPPTPGSPPPVSSTVRVAGFLVPRVGLGCMRLSTADRPERAVALATLHAALDAGVRVLDTADTYCLNHTDLHHNEALIREALETWSGPRHEVLVATKAGLARPNGRWLPAGSPEQLRAAAQGSRGALGVPRLALLQLHAPHGKAVPFATQVEALAALRAEGVTEHVGLCNVTVAQLDEAIAITEIACVQVELSRTRPAALDGGLLLRCAELGIPVLAHSPLGGHRTIEAVRKDPAWRVAVGGPRSTRSPSAPTHPGGDRPPSPEELALAWTLACGPDVVALPGARSPETARSSASAARLHLDAAALATLDAAPARAAARAAVAAAGPPEIVLIAGPPAAGKTSRVQPFLARGYERLNRDTLGGRLADVDRRLQASLLAGQRRFVLDNTYADGKSRAPALALGARFGVPVRCVWVDTSERDADLNACLRMIARRGRLLTAEEIKASHQDDPNSFPPVAIRSFFQRAERPKVEEGFASIEVVPFVRRWPPQHTRRALILDYDGTLRRSRGPAPFPLQPDDVLILPGRKQVLAAFAADGWLLLGVSNQSGVARGQLTHDGVRACFDRTNELLGVSIDVRWDEHPSGPIHNWTRKPMPGLGVQLILDHLLDPALCVYVGDMDTDAQFAAACGFRYAEARDFFEDDGHRFVRGD